MAKGKKNGGKLNGFATSIFRMGQAVTYTTPALKIGPGGNIFIENCNRIVAYNEGEIAFYLGKIIVEVRGDGLEMKSLNQTGAELMGRIHSIEFLYPGG